MTGALRPPARIAGFAAVLALALAAIVYRLVQVQLVEGDHWTEKARANQIQIIPVAAPRGLIEDRTGKTLVRSRPSWVCALIPSQVKDVDATLRALAGVLKVPETTLRRRLLHHHGHDFADFDEVRVDEPNGPVILVDELKPAQVARISEVLASIPGVDIERQAVRDYPYHRMAAHVFGYVGAMDEAQYRARRREGYAPNDDIGQDGLEAVYDRWLHGHAGGEKIEVNAQGQMIKPLGMADPVPGNTLVTTIDLRLQRILDRNLAAQLAKWGKGRGKRLAGAAVILDPATGGVLAMSSYPVYDPNAFATPIDAKTYGALLRDPLQPMYDRAIGAASPTGSTFKMITGSGAISARVISPDQVLYDSGAWFCHGVTFRDIASGGLGSTDFIRALAASSDGYFYQLGDRLGHTRLRYYATQYGLGTKTGIDLPGEYPGNWPTEAWVQRTFGKEYHLEPSDVCQLAIGQGSMQATPLQMADVMGAVVNGGDLFRPHLVAEIRSPYGRVLQRYDHELIRHVDVTSIALRMVRTGMAKVTDPGGTAYGLAIPGLPFGGKTGTAETEGGHGPNTTWFVAYAPADHPKIAMAVYMEKSGGYGASVAAPVAQHVIAEYFGKKIDPL